MNITRDILSIVENAKELEKSLRKPVMISSHEVDRITVNRLIEFYHAANDVNKIHLESIIRSYFFDDDEWEKYVVNGVEVKS